MTVSDDFPMVARMAEAIRRALASGSTSTADRLVTELISRTMQAEMPLPAHALDAPESTGDERYDALIKVGLAYALTSRGQEPEPWMLSARALPEEWLWDSDGGESDEFRALIRRDTPKMFLDKSILVRAKDLIAM